MCVRLDRRAVYLGTPGGRTSTARPRRVGRRRAILVEPARRALAPRALGRCRARPQRIAAASAGGSVFTGLGFDACSGPLLAVDGGLGRIALPGDRRLHRRRQPRLLAAEPDRELGQRPDRRRLAPDPDLRRPAGADQQLQQLRQAQRQPRRPRRGQKRPSTRSPRPPPSRSAPAARSTSTWSPTRRTSSATAATLAFLEAWTEKLHSLGYVSGVYSSSASGIADLAGQVGSDYVLPDDLWIANWNGQANTTDPVRPRQRLDPAPAHPPVPRRPRRDLRRRHDQHRQQLRRRGDGRHRGVADRRNEDPIGSLDLVGAPTPGQVRVKGWAFDLNAPTEPLAIRAYVGGRPGAPGAVAYDLGAIANQARADVGAKYRRAGANHGFDVTFPTVKSGPQPVCVYALNTGGGADRLLGCKSTTIPVAVTLSGAEDDAARASRSAVTCEWPQGTDCPGQLDAPHPGQDRPAAPPRHAAADPRRHPLARAPPLPALPASSGHGFVIPLSAGGRALLKQRGSLSSQLIAAIPGGAGSSPLGLGR